MLDHDVRSLQLLEQQERQRGPASAAADDSERAEEVHRARQVAGEKHDREQIEKHPQRAAEAIVGATRRALANADGHLCDPGTVHRGQYRDEAMQIAVQPEMVQQVRAVCLERAAKVAQLDARQLADQPVRDARRQPPRQQAVVAVLAPAVDQVVAFLDLGQQRGNVLGSMLQIAVHRDNHLSRGGLEAGCQGSGLAGVAPQADCLQPRLVGA